MSKLKEKTEMSHDDAIDMNGEARAQPLATAEIEITENTSLETTLGTADVAEIGFLGEVKIKYPDKKKQKANYFSISAEAEEINLLPFTGYLQIFKQRYYKPVEKWKKKTTCVIIDSLRFMYDMVWKIKSLKEL